MKHLLSTVILCVILISCHGPKIDQNEESNKIMALSREWSKVAATDSLEKLLSYWADDAVCLFPGKGIIKGKAAIRENLRASASIPGFEVSWEPSEAYVSSDGDMAYVIGQNYFNIPDSAGKIITTFNKSIEIWKKQVDGTWKCVVDMYNSDPTIKAIR